MPAAERVCPGSGFVLAQALAAWKSAYYVAWTRRPVATFRSSSEQPPGWSCSMPRAGWSIAQIAASNERFYPLSLAALLPRFLSGESLEEELERWPGAG